MNIKLKERKEAVLGELKITDTFKIPESSFIFMKMDVDGLTVRPKAPLPSSQLSTEQKKATKPIRVLIPEGKTTVINLSTGKAQFLNLQEKVQIVDFDAKEVINEKGV